MVGGEREKWTEEKDGQKRKMDRDRDEEIRIENLSDDNFSYS